jgi:hypothetical protein
MGRIDQPAALMRAQFAQGKAARGPRVGSVFGGVRLGLRLMPCLARCGRALRALSGEHGGESFTLRSHG